MNTEAGLTLMANDTAKNQVKSKKANGYKSKGFGLASDVTSDIQIPSIVAGTKKTVDSTGESAMAKAPWQPLTNVEKVYLWSNPLVSSANLRLAKGTPSLQSPPTMSKTSGLKNIRRLVSKSGKKSNQKRPKTSIGQTSSGGSVVASGNTHSDIVISPKKRSTVSVSQEPRITNDSDKSDKIVLRVKKIVKTVEVEGSLDSTEDKSQRSEPAVFDPDQQKNGKEKEGKPSKVTKVVKKKSIRKKPVVNPISAVDGQMEDDLQNFADLQSTLENDVKELIAQIEAERKKKLGTNSDQFQRNVPRWESKNLAKFLRLLQNQKKIVQLQIDICQGLSNTQPQLDYDQREECVPYRLGSSIIPSFELFAPYACERDGRMVFHCSLCDVISESEMLFRLHLESPQHHQHIYGKVEKDVPEGPNKQIHNQRPGLSVKLGKKLLKPLQKTAAPMPEKPVAASAEAHFTGNEILQTLI